MKKVEHCYCYGDWTDDPSLSSPLYLQGTFYLSRVLSNCEISFQALTKLPKIWNSIKSISQVDELEGWPTYMERYTAVKRKMDWIRQLFQTTLKKDIFMDVLIYSIIDAYIPHFQCAQVKLTPYLSRFCYIYTTMISYHWIHTTCYECRLDLIGQKKFVI